MEPKLTILKVEGIKSFMKVVIGGMVDPARSLVSFVEKMLLSCDGYSDLSTEETGQDDIQSPFSSKRIAQDRNCSGCIDSAPDFVEFVGKWLLFDPSRALVPTTARTATVLVVSTEITVRLECAPEFSGFQGKWLLFRLSRASSLFIVKSPPVG